MGDGVRPRGSKSYAASRDPEAAEAFRQDRAAQQTFDTEKKVCPKCGSEMKKIDPEDEDGDMSVMLQFGVLSEPKMLCLHCGHEEKVKA